VAGPVEATALGNIVVQAIATGKLPNLAAGRAAVAASADLAVYEPHNGDTWDVAVVGFDALVAAADA
jgi:rhamnulokinase